MARLKDVLPRHPGPQEVRLCLINGGRKHLLRLDEGLRVTPTSALMGDLKALLDPSCLSGGASIHHWDTSDSFTSKA